MSYLMADVAGLALDSDDMEFLRHPGIAGVTLFARNYSEPRQLAELTAELHALRTQEPLLIAVDQEGGRVQRFVDGFTRLPPMCALGELYQNNGAQAQTLARDCGAVMAGELRQLGVDLSFAPVLDVASVHSSVIGERSLSADASVVVSLARDIIRGMNEMGMSAVGKHFPGHGGVAADSHHALPVDKRPAADVMALDVLPYRSLIDSLAGVMSAHVTFAAVDSRPSTFSRYWLTGVLRGELKFRGVVFSDDLSMAGAGEAGGPADRVRAALAAGCDVALVCNDRKAAAGVIDALGEGGDAVGLRLKGATDPVRLPPQSVQRVKSFSTSYERVVRGNE
jgi:beta-N-acetylhexosaminidase